MTGGEITLGCVHAGFHKDDIIGTLRSDLVPCGVGDVGRGRTGAAVSKSVASRCKADIRTSPNVVNGDSGDGFRNV